MQLESPLHRATSCAHIEGMCLSSRKESKNCKHLACVEEVLHLIESNKHHCWDVLFVEGPPLGKCKTRLIISLKSTSFCYPLYSIFDVPPGLDRWPECNLI